MREEGVDPLHAAGFLSHNSLNWMRMREGEGEIVTGHSKDVTKKHKEIHIS